MTHIHTALQGIGAFALVCALATSAAHAQTRTPVPFQSATGQSVRIRLSSGAKVQGALTVIDTRDGRLVLGDPARAFNLEQIDSLWIGRDRVREAATIGGVVAGLSMFAFTTGLCFTGGGCLTSGPGDTAGARWRTVGLSTVAATAAGALAGGVAGRFLRRWVPVAMP